MAIRYTSEYNAEIRRVVKNFNARRERLAKRGIKLTKAPIKVSELKSRYQTRGELNKELELLNEVSSSSDNLLKKIETQGGATAIKWNLEYLKLNAKQAIKYFEHEKEIELSKNPKYPHERARLNEVEQTS